MYFYFCRVVSHYRIMVNILKFHFFYQNFAVVRLYHKILGGMENCVDLQSEWDLHNMHMPSRNLMVLSHETFQSFTKLGF